MGVDLPDNIYLNMAYALAMCGEVTMECVDMTGNKEKMIVVIRDPSGILGRRMQQAAREQGFDYDPDFDGRDEEDD